MIYSVLIRCFDPCTNRSHQSKSQYITRGLERPIWKRLQCIPMLNLTGDDHARQKEGSSRPPSKGVIALGWSMVSYAVSKKLGYEFTPYKLQSSVKSWQLRHRRIRVGSFANESHSQLISWRSTPQANAPPGNITPSNKNELYYGICRTNSSKQYEGQKASWSSTFSWEEWSYRLYQKGGGFLLAPVPRRCSRAPSIDSDRRVESPCSHERPLTSQRKLSLRHIVM